MNPELKVEDPGQETTAEYSRAVTFLQPHHLRLLLDSGIWPEVSRARGYQTVTGKSALKGYGFSAEQCRPPALLIPIYDAGGRLISYQIRPDEPRIDRHAGAIEYEICPGRPFALDFPPACASLLADPGIPLYITDEVFKADSAASQRLCCVALVGISLTADGADTERSLGSGVWDGIILDNRVVRLVCDADSTRRPGTESAFAYLQEFLWSRHARIQRIRL